MYHAESVRPWKGAGTKGPSIMVVERVAWGQQSGGLLVQPFDQGGWHEVGVATRLAKVGQGNPMVASGHGHVLGGDVDEVDGPLLHLFDYSRGLKVAVGEVLAQIGHDGGWEEGSQMMG